MKTHLIVLLFFITASLQAQTAIDSVNTWAFQLQNFDINTIATNNSFELIVTDYSHDGSEGSKLTAAEVATVKNSGKLYISYISIGEAEDYRSYWQSSWNTTPPAWLDAENPDWAGNYKVKYWHPDWQNIVYAYLDTIIAQGFDGAYLDIIDAWYYWQQEVSAGQVADADSLMIDFVINIRNHVNTARGDSSFIIIPQNGEDLIFQNNISPSLRNQYYQAINAVGIEDVFYTGANEMDNNYAPDTYRLDNLKAYQQQGKKVFNIEYLSLPAKINQYKDTVATYGFIPYICVRALDQLCDGIPTSITGPATTKNHIYPNPVTGNTLYITGIAGQSPLYLLDAIGHTISIANCNPVSGGKYEINIPASLSNGVYFLKSKDESTTTRFILNR